jgi:hypothetical protein
MLAMSELSILLSSGCFTNYHAEFSTIVTLGLNQPGPQVTGRVLRLLRLYSILSCRIKAKLARTLEL